MILINNNLKRLYQKNKNLYYVVLTWTFGSFWLIFRKNPLKFLLNLKIYRYKYSLNIIYLLNFKFINATLLHHIALCKRA